jgi:hypothetical protein
VSGFTGYLADELNNITFPGEREAAVKTLAAFASYLSVDAEIRRLENSGPEHHQDAVNLCVGSAAGQSHWAFAQFDSALGETLRINQEQFDRAVKAGLSSVGTLNGRVTIWEIAHTMEFKAFAWAVVIAALIAAGLAPRIKEYE